MNDITLRRNLLELLSGGGAYPTIKKALSRINPSSRHARSGIGLHSIWEELEHMRLAQEDILKYTLDPKWKSPKWPEGYWPNPDKSPTSAMWNSSIKRFFADLNALKSLIRNRQIDLSAEIPHGEGRTYLREILLTADHNSYHTGQIILIRKMLNDWKS